VTKLLVFLDCARPLNRFQSSFRKCHGTITALLGVSDDIYRMLDQKMFAALLLLDFSKAFDSVDHKLLCRKFVRFFGFSSSAVRFLKYYLRRRFQRVFVNGVFSEFLPVDKGFPQGSVLVLLLFSLFINDLCAVITSMYHVYADGFQIYAGTPWITLCVVWND
jgi:ribonucleases P/MRP protein subunit RPP40